MQKITDPLKRKELLEEICQEEDKKIFRILNHMIKGYDTKKNINSQTKLEDDKYFKDLQDELPPLDQ